MVAVPGLVEGIWVTSAEDIILRKLEWFVQGGRSSDRQWRDVLGILQVQGDELDWQYLRQAAEHVGLAKDLAEALRQCGHDTAG